MNYSDPVGTIQKKSSSPAHNTFQCKPVLTITVWLFRVFLKNEQYQPYLIFFLSIKVDSMLVAHNFPFLC